MPLKAALRLATLLALVAAGCAGPEAGRRTSSIRRGFFSEESAFPLPARPLRTVAQVPVRLLPQAPGALNETSSRRTVPSLRQGLRPDTGAHTRALGMALAQAPGRVPSTLPGASSQERLEFFLASTSPGDFIERQRGVDLPALLEELDDWDAARLGALGPLRAGADILDRKRANLIVQLTHDFGPDRADVFTLYLVHTAFEREIQDVLRRLGADKRLSNTVFQMPLVREALHRRGIDLSAFADRPERKSDALRGIKDGVVDALDSSDARKGAMGLQYSFKKLQLPPPYQHVLDQIEEAQVAALFSQRNVMLGCLDSLTFGMVTGLPGLVVGTYRGLDALDRGQYQQAGRELTPAGFLLLLYMGGKTSGTPSAEAPPLAERAPALLELEPGGARVREAARWEQAQGFPERGSPLAQLGRDELLRLAGYLLADREAALFLHDHGQAGALALSRSRGNLATAQRLLSEVEKPLAMAAGDTGRAPTAGTGPRGGGSRSAPLPADAPSPPAPKQRGSRTTALSESSALEESANPEEVLARKLDELEQEEDGERMVGELTALELRRPVLDKPPPGTHASDPVWSRYVAYWAERFRVLVEEQQAAAPPEQPQQNPRTFSSYQRFFTNITKALEFEAEVAAELRRQAELPPEQRTWLKLFTDPRIERHVGVSKGRGFSTRYPDVVVLERKPGPGQPLRIETFSIKWRDLSSMSVNELVAQFSKDAGYAENYYGGVIELRRPSLKMQGKTVQVSKVHLIYDASLKPMDSNALATALGKVRTIGVEIHFQ